MTERISAEELSRKRELRCYFLDNRWSERWLKSKQSLTTS